jgi:hypothetical protein
VLSNLRYAISRLRQKDNIKKVSKRDRMGGTGWTGLIWLRIRKIGRFRFYKIPGIF